MNLKVSVINIILKQRRHYINPKTFKTGDILIYKNNNDAVYNVVKGNKLNKTYITYENGEFAYIYIEGKGFVGYINNNKNIFIGS